MCILQYLPRPIPHPMQAQTVSNTLTNTVHSDNRIQTIDILRGLLIILMALDHVRDFFMFDAFAISATDPEKASVALFTTRWITHLCAPGFVWLAGISAFIYAKKNGIKKTSGFLFSRGLILIILELTVVKIGWHFNVDYSQVGLLVIWALGLSMILLAITCWLKQQTVFILGVAIIACHNLLDGIQLTEASGGGALLWYILHQSGAVALSDNFTVYVLYPVLPMYGLICLGYGMGSLFTNDTKETRIPLFKRLSLLLLLAFVSIRLINIYGDLQPWVFNQYFYRTAFSFLNVTKYPMSLDYILITLSVLFYIIYIIEKRTLWIGTYLALFGKVSMFFYLIHIFVIHLLAVIVFFATHIDTFSSDTKIDMQSLTANYGYPLFVIYPIWITILVALYPLCKKYKTFKSLHPNSVLKFL